MIVRLSLTAEDTFVEELDRAVMAYRGANLERTVTRSTFMREAIARAMREIRPNAGAAEPQMRERQRATA